MEAEKPHDLLSANWAPRKARRVNPCPLFHLSCQAKREFTLPPFFWSCLCPQQVLWLPTMLERAVHFTQSSKSSADLFPNALGDAP